MGGTNLAMPPVFRSRAAADPRSRGKIVRSRRAAGARTPYDRPTPTPAPQNPSWLSRFLLPPTRLIASGAGKILSSVFTPDSDSDSSSEDDFDVDDNDIPSERADYLNKKDGTSEMAERIMKGDEHEQMSETKCAIEELIMQETFSREESDKLIRIIKSRVVGSTFIEDMEDRRRLEIFGSDGEMPSLCSTALLEAKKWLEEKRLESSSKPERDLTFNSAMFPHVTVDNEGSPVDVAKSYMRVRPPWASPSSSPSEFKSPSSIGVQLFREEIPYTIGGNSMSSKLKRDYNATGSWNIREEIRRLRSKATEEMLKTPPSAKINWSAPAVESKGSLNLFVTDEVGRTEDKMEKSSSSLRGVMNSTGMAASPQFPVMESARDLSQNGALSSNPANCVAMIWKQLGS